MVTFKELKPIIDGVISDLENIIEKMRSYTKFDTDFRATALVEDVRAIIHQINSVYYNVYSHPEFKDVYGENANFDYTNYVKMIREYVDRYEEVYQRIKKFENINESYADKPNFFSTENEPER